MKALITGASSGLGREMAYYLNDLGYDLVLIGRDLSGLKETEKNCHTKVKIIKIDLSQEKEVIKLFEDNKNIDFLINNAGFGLFGNFYETDLDKELEMINVNIKAVHILTKLYLKEFVNLDKGIILNVSSVAGFWPGPQLSTYYGTKSYVTKQAMAIYQELKNIKSNVKISVLCPGPFDSKFNKTAGTNFNNGGITAKEIAKIAIDQTLKGKLVITPETKWKILLFFAKFIPSKTIMSFISNFQNKKKR